MLRRWTNVTSCSSQKSLFSGTAWQKTSQHPCPAVTVGQHKLQPGQEVPAPSGAVVIRRHPPRARAVLYGKDITLAK